MCFFIQISSGASHTLSRFQGFASQHEVEYGEQLPHTWLCAYTNSFSPAIRPVLPQPVALADSKPSAVGPWACLVGVFRLSRLDLLYMLAGEKSFTAQLTWKGGCKHVTD